MNPLRFFQKLGAACLDFPSYLGQLAQLVADMVVSTLSRPLRFRLIGQQIVSIGFGAQFVIIVTGGFTGAVFAAQTYFKFSDFGLGSATGPVVSLAMCRELGPVLTAIMLAGWGGAAMAAEIGTMKVTEQIDALRSMGVSPVDYLVMPRVFGMFFSMPLLVAEATGFGILAGHLVAVHYFGIPSAWFSHQVMLHTGLGDILIGMIKGFVFGGVIVVISCHQGLNAKEGAAGVGRAATTAFVKSALAIFVINLFLSLLLNHFFPLSEGTS